MMGSSTDPYYGAPVVVLILADGSASTFMEDGSCVLENMMLAVGAIALGYPAQEAGQPAARKQNYIVRI
jgi:hypothetical protein